MHGGQRHRQLLAHGVLTLQWKRIRDPRDGCRHVGGVHGGEDEVAGLRRRQRNPHRLRVAHFADDDDVGRLANGGTQRGREVGRVDADLDLLDQAAAVRVLVFDRVLDGDDVALVALVDRGDQRRQRRGLARAGGPADQHEAARQRREQADVVREMQVRDLRNPQRQRADGGCGAAALAVQVHPEAAELRPA